MGCSQSILESYETATTVSETTCRSTYGPRYLTSIPTTSRITQSVIVTFERPLQWSTSCTYITVPYPITETRFIVVTETAPRTIGVPTSTGTAYVSSTVYETVGGTVRQTETAPAVTIAPQAYTVSAPIDFTPIASNPANAGADRATAVESSRATATTQEEQSVETMTDDTDDTITDTATSLIYETTTVTPTYELSELPRPTRYAACGADNIIGGIGGYGIVDIDVQPRGRTGISAIPMEAYRSPQSCCEACVSQVERTCAGSVWLLNTCYFILNADSCNGSEAVIAFDLSRGREVAANKGMLLSNGACGQQVWSGRYCDQLARDCAVDPAASSMSASLK